MQDCAGYAKPMEELITSNEGLPSRFPTTFHFPDFSEKELHKILTDRIKTNEPPFTVQDSKYVRIAVRRLSLQRGKTGFGNARAVRTIWDQVKSRQSGRVIAEREAGGSPNSLEIQRDDLLGPRDVKAAVHEPLKELQKMRGLASVKRNVEALLQLVQTNVELEEEEKPLQRVGLSFIC